MVSNLSLEGDREMAKRLLTEVQWQSFLERVDQRGENECWEWTGYCHPKGYGQVTFYKDVWKTHRLAYERVYGPIPGRKYVCHKCNNPPCCNPRHLYLGAKGETGQKDNMEQCVRDNRIARGVNHPNCSFTDEQVQEVRHLLAADVAQCEVARRYNVTQQTIGQILFGKSYSWLKSDLTPEEERNLEKVRQRGKHRSGAGLTEIDVLAIRRWLKQRVGPLELARRYNVSDETIRCIKNRKSYAHIPEEAV